MNTEYPAPQGLIDLAERKYDLKVIDSHYILTDAKFQTYHMMLDVQMNEAMTEVFQKTYKNMEEADGVSWDIRPQTNSVRFCAEIGNNIMLFWDKLQAQANKINGKKTERDIFSPDYYIKLNQQSAKFQKIYDDSCGCK